MAAPRGMKRRWLAALALVTVATLALGAAARGLGTARALLFLPTGGAEWIWARLPRDYDTPIAFYAVRDFTLDAPPAGARLLALADEEYVLHVNGKRVGSGIYSPGAPLDVYEVGPLLRAGGNRILVELRSGRGWGGFLARLEDGAGREIAGTDRRWRIFRKHRDGLLTGLLPLGREDGEPAHSWGRPPAGRWGLPVPGPEIRPALAAAPAPIQEPGSSTSAATGSTTSPTPGSSSGLTPGPMAGSATGPPPPPHQTSPAAPASPEAAALAALAALTGPAPLPPASARRAPARAAFDWDREVEGYLVLTLAPREEVAVGLLRTVDGEEARSPVLVVPGAGEWIDARPRRLRWAEVTGISGVAAARVLPAPGTAAPLPPPPDGVLGMSPPPLRTPVEEKVRRELERVSGVARGDDR